MTLYLENSATGRKKYGDEDNDSVHSKEEFPISGVFEAMQLSETSPTVKDNLSLPSKEEEYLSFPVLSGEEGKTVNLSDQSNTESKKSLKKKKIDSKLESIRKR